MRVTVIGNRFRRRCHCRSFCLLWKRSLWLDIDEAKVASLREGKVPFYEPGLKNY